jgi:c-di-GMP-binding flagellar brake protein YcgR
MDDLHSTHPSSEIERDERDSVSAFTERLAILNQLCERRALVRVQAQGSGESLLSTLVMVDADQRAILFDGGRDADSNRALEQAGLLTLVTDLDGIRIQFEVQGAQSVSYENSAAFLAAFPASILRLQRREFFRIAPPPNRPIMVQLHARLGNASYITAARGVDISCGGMVLLIEGEIKGLETGQILPRTSITLPEVATIETGLEVRNIVFSQRAGSSGSTRVGCRFVDLNQANSARVQRYINRLEVELRRRT